MHTLNAYICKTKVNTCTKCTVWHKILMGEILTNFQQFVNIFPIKFFHLVSYLPLINLWRSGSTRNKIMSEAPSLENHSFQSSLSHYTTILQQSCINYMTINSFMIPSFTPRLTMCGNQSMHVLRCDITCPTPCPATTQERCG